MQQIIQTPTLNSLMVFIPRQSLIHYGGVGRFDELHVAAEAGRE